MPSLRYLLLCLMVLALPMQGFAAASMLHCGGAGSETALQIQSPSDARHQGGGSHHHGDGGHGQQGDAAAHAHAPDLQAQALASDAPASAAAAWPDASHHCGACAACCNLVALSEFPLAVVAVPASATRQLEPAPAVYAAPLRLPEKPPRA
jgi:hypothetical protein